MEFSKPEYWSGLHFPSPGDLPNPGIEIMSPALQAYSLTPEPRGKPKNAGVGSLSLLQGILLTQESNQGLLHCRRILYQLSYQGSPICVKNLFIWITVPVHYFRTSKTFLINYIYLYGEIDVFLWNVLVCVINNHDCDYFITVMFIINLVERLDVF